jgi:hypothetical protein
MRYLDDSKSKGILTYRKHLFYLGLLLLALLDIFLPRDPYFWYDGLPGFYAVFGLISCILLIIICKALGHHWLMVREDYYDEIPLNPPLLKGENPPQSPFVKGGRKGDLGRKHVD